MTQVLPFLLMTFAIFAQSLSVSGLAAGATAATAPTILVYGDSLSAGYGLGAKEGWVTLLDERLRAQKLRYTVVNASISGETSAGGASRIAQALERHRPAIVVVALGSNDGLRGLPVAQLKNNLTAIVTAAQGKRSRVLIVGNRMPPNYGAKYADSFANAFG
ncbi:MAG: arylesterase, partial [Burkholderiales bacterium]